MNKIGDFNLTYESDREYYTQMKTIAPNYYRDFHCIADKCRHTCCEGWEIDVDEESLPRFLSDEFIAPHIDTENTPHIKLCNGERCPFLRNDGLCEMILKRGEDVLCQICRDHPRFRNFWSDREEVGIGLVCEEAARLILSKKEKMTLVTLADDGINEELSDNEKHLLDLRQKLLDEITESGAKARLKEYLIYRHLPDALYDGMEEERILFINDSFDGLIAKWNETDGTLCSLIEIVRVWSYDVEYDDEVIANKLDEYMRERHNGR